MDTVGSMVITENRWRGLSPTMRQWLRESLDKREIVGRLVRQVAGELDDLGKHDLAACLYQVIREQN